MSRLLVSVVGALVLFAAVPSQASRKQSGGSVKSEGSAKGKRSGSSSSWLKRHNGGWGNPKGALHQFLDARGLKKSAR